MEAESQLEWWVMCKPPHTWKSNQQWKPWTAFLKQKCKHFNGIHCYVSYDLRAKREIMPTWPFSFYFESMMALVITKYPDGFSSSVKSLPIMGKRTLMGALRRLLHKDPPGKNLSSNDRWCEDGKRLSDTFMILPFSLAYVPFERAHGVIGRQPWNQLTEQRKH